MRVVTTCLLAFALTSALVASACSDDGGSSDGDPTRDLGRDAGGDDGPRGCEGSDDCGTGLVCDPVAAACVPLCLGDADCGPTERCEAASGLCVDRAPCSETAECGTGEACDTCLGVCVDSGGGAFCLEDVNCPDFDQYCDACVGECRPRGQFCDACVDDDECGEQRDECLTDARGNRFCGGACGGGLPPCPLGATCDDATSQCVPLTGDCSQISECDDDVDCTGARICGPSSICIDGCTGDEACPSDRVCNGGRCEPRCTGPVDCEGDEECLDGRCRAPGSCVTSWDCPEAEMYCDRETSRCVDGCKVDDDCRTFSLICREGVCVPRGCRGNYSCAFGQVCNLETGACEEPAEPHCSTCNGDDLDSCGEDNICAALQDADGNVQGAFCWLACAADPDNACPQGYACEAIEIQQQGGASEIRRVCARACYRTPIDT